MCVLEASDTIRCVLWSPCSESRLNPRTRTYTTLINVILWSVFPWKITSIFPIFYFNFPMVPDRNCFATGRRGPQVIQSCPIVRNVARRAAVSDLTIILTAARLHYEYTVLITTRYSNIPYNACTRYAQLAWWRKLRLCGPVGERARGRLRQNGRSIRIRRLGG